MTSAQSICWKLPILPSSTSGCLDLSKKAKWRAAPSTLHPTHSVRRATEDVGYKYPDAPRFMDQSQSIFRDIHCTCDFVYRELHKQGVGVTIRAVMLE